MHPVLCVLLYRYMDFPIGELQFQERTPFLFQILLSNSINQLKTNQNMEEMEMKALNNTKPSQDLTPPIPPLSFSLHNSHLNSHCSSCFNPLNCHRSLSCPNCSRSINYCSSFCLASDSVRHNSSHECDLFNHLRQLEISSDDSTDLRVALRLLYHFEINGDLQFSDRIGGLLIADLDEVLKEESELSEKIKSDAMLMSAVRKEGKEGLKLEMLILWGVLRNSVEIQLSEFGSIGVGVYGLGFSWFNHSCVPNASYRFELSNLSEKEVSFCANSEFLVVPTGTGDSKDLMEKLNCRRGTTSQGFNFGPRVIVRSIRPIRKGEQVCITYTDLLQPKDKRQLELWSKYRFICQCNRCSESPLNYIDYILTCDSKSLNSQDRTGTGTSASSASKQDQLYSEIQEAIEEYTSFNNPKSCCDKIETILSQNFLSLHPLHFLSLNAYIALSSAYKFQFQVSQKNIFFNLARIALAYSILLSFSTYNLFLFEPSLVATTSHFLLSTGEIILSIFDIQELVAFSSFQSQSNPDSDFESNAKQFIECVSNLLPNCWPFLVQNNSYLEKIKNPIDFSWIGLKMNQHNALSDGKIECFACKVESNMICEKEMKYLYKLAIHCIFHGMYLANICYGPQHYLISKVKTLLYL